ncbi:MAG: hypothetical protein AAGG07_07900 [Planctomycetota bacterium]
MAKKRHLVLIKPAGDPLPGAVTETEPLGTAGSIASAVSRFNTATDGFPSPALGLETLHGPGYTMQIPTTAEEVRQVMVTVVDDETAWPVLSRMCRALEWKMMDQETGRVFG